VNLEQITAPGAAAGNTLQVTASANGGYISQTFTKPINTDFIVGALLHFWSGSASTHAVSAQIQVWEGSTEIWDSGVVQPLGNGLAYNNSAWRFVKQVISGDTATSYTVRIIAPTAGSTTTAELSALFILPSVQNSFGTASGTGATCGTSGTFVAGTGSGSGLGQTYNCTVVGENSGAQSNKVVWSTTAQATPSFLHAIVTTASTTASFTVQAANGQQAEAFYIPAGVTNYEMTFPLSTFAAYVTLVDFGGAIANSTTVQQMWVGPINQPYIPGVSSSLTIPYATAAGSAATVIPASVTAGPSLAYFNDFYSAADVTSQAIGSPTGNACALSSTVSSLNHPGAIKLTSGTVSAAGDACFVSSYLYSLNTAPGWTWESGVYVPVLPSTTAGAYQAGIASTQAASPWVGGAGFYLSAANGTPNDWYCEYGSTYTDSTVAATVGWVRLSMVSDGTNVHWYINGTQICGTGVAISNMPSQAFMDWTAVSLTTTSMSYYVDYVDFIRTLSR
jgi:hypothetical protein